MNKINVQPIIIVDKVSSKRETSKRVKPSTSQFFYKKPLTKDAFEKQDKIIINVK